MRYWLLYMITSTERIGMFGVDYYEDENGRKPAE